MVHDQGRQRLGDVDDAVERHLHAVASRHEDAVEVGRVALIARVDLQDDAILVALRVDGRNLPLREGVVERVVDVLDVDAEPRRGLPVDLDGGLQAALLAIGRYVGEPRDLAQALDHLGHPVIEHVEFGAPERELVLRSALPRAGANILRREERNIETFDA